MGLGRELAEITRRRFPTLWGQPRQLRGKIEPSADASGACHRLLSPFQESALRKPTGDGWDKQRRGGQDGSVRGCSLLIQLEGRQPGISGIGHALRALSLYEGCQRSWMSMQIALAT